MTFDFTKLPKYCHACSAALYCIKSRTCQVDQDDVFRYVHNIEDIICSWCSEHRVPKEILEAIRNDRKGSYR